MRSILLAFASVSLIYLAAVSQAHAQARILPRTLDTLRSTDAASLATESAGLASPSAEEQAKLEQIKEEDVTKPEEGEQREEVFELFTLRPAQNISPTNFMAFAIQNSAAAGVPARTIMLILLVPVLATIIAFFRHVIGLPSIGLLVPIALSITLISTGLTAGLLLLSTIIFASIFARFAFKKLRIMQLPKMALSMMIVSIFVLAILTISSLIGILTVRQLSIFPVLLLILLSERIIGLQLERSTQEAFRITLVTLGFGILGFLLLSATLLQNAILLYPELILLLVPINIIVGRYFGLRLTEYFRFRPITHNASK